MKDLRSRIYDLGKYLFTIDLYRKHPNVRIWKYSDKQFGHEDEFIHWITNKLTDTK